MKKKIEKKLTLKMIPVARLSTNEAQLIQGGAAFSRPTGPAGLPTVPCISLQCTVACPHG
jgi:hypothetical protein